MKRSLVLFSGGLDSFCCLVRELLILREDEILTLSFYKRDDHPGYLQAKSICKELHIDQISIKVDDVGKLVGNDNAEGRNSVYLSYASLVANQYQIPRVVIGIEEDCAETQYVDCSKAFIQAFNSMAQTLYHDSVRIYAPLVSFSKIDVWKECDQLGRLEMAIERTYSCWRGGAEECGECPACKRKYLSLRTYLEKRNKGRA